MVHYYFLGGEGKQVRLNQTVYGLLFRELNRNKISFDIDQKTEGSVIKTTIKLSNNYQW